MNRAKTILFGILIMFSANAMADPLRADYVIVGVGTAGAVVANKLSNDGKTSVIALHSGKNETKNPFIKFSKNAVYTIAAALLGTSLSNVDPALFNSLPLAMQQHLEQLLHSSNFKITLFESGMTAPQVDADDRQLLWVIAQPEGGASSINAGAWLRGTDQIFSQWEAIAGPNWSVKSIEKSYKEIEDYHGNTSNPKARGFNGPLNIHQPPASRLSKKFTKAVIKATGLPFVLDFNDPNTPIGPSSQFQVTQHGDNGRFRDSSAVSFLNKGALKPNGKGAHDRKLRVLFDSFVLRTIWEGTKAIGVEYLHHGKIKQVFANKGIIVCAGLRSSTFLLQSGIGPQSTLQALGIPVVFDNPSVGQGLFDQPQLPLLFSTNPNDAATGPTFSVFDQMSQFPLPGGDPIIRRLRLAITAPIPGLAFGLFDLVQPKSRGSITISSSNPLDHPIIDLGYFTNPEDLAVYQTGLQVYVKSIAEQLHAIDPAYQLIFPDPIIFNDINLLTDYIKETVASNQCFQSHCRMAPLSQGGVVDSFGRVYGVQNLLVADNSINPIGIDGTPMATGYLVAWHIARLLGY